MYLFHIFRIIRAFIKRRFHPSAQTYYVQHCSFFVNTAAFFVSHRLPIALEAMRRGYHVVLITGKAGSAAMESAIASKLATAGIVHPQVDFSSVGINQVAETVGIFQLVRHLRKLRQDILHCTTPKGIMYGGLAVRLAHNPKLVLAH